MIRTLLVACAILGFALGCFAQDEAQYQTWMKSVGPSRAAINAAITAKDNAAVATEANKLAATFDQVAKFWTARKADDAIKFAETARDAAKAAAAATDSAAQMAAMQTLGAQCMGCHAAHREGSGGQFKIK